LNKGKKTVYGAEASTANRTIAPAVHFDYWAFLIGGRLMKRKWILLVIVLAVLGAGGYAAWYFLSSPQYSLVQVQKAVEQRDASKFEKYVDLEGIIRRAGNQLSSQLTANFAKELGGFSGLEPELVNGAMAAFSSAMIEPTVKQVREAILSFVETGRTTPIQAIPADIVDIAADLRIESMPTIEAKGKMATIDINLSAMGEPVRVRLFMRNLGSYWQIAEIDAAGKVAQDVLSAYVRGQRKYFESERAAHPDTKIEVPGAPLKSMPLTMCYIPKGKFKMGSPENEKDRDQDETQHKVTITKPVWIAKYEVTNGQFDAFVQTTGYQTTAEKEGSGFALDLDRRDWVFTKGVNFRNPGFSPFQMDAPVVLVSWEDAQAFCRWLSEQSGWNFRLPTEAEWEYACRAGTATARFTGDSDGSLEGYANGLDASFNRVCDKWVAFKWDDHYVYTSPVGSFRPNPWGLHDMIGNAWEWCSDWYGEYPPGAGIDPTGPPEGSRRVARGGGWFSGPRRCRAAFRSRDTPGNRGGFLGFRLAASPAVR
jgi:formylglycine-generating enzyme required for sulfatase activity